jgi:hypothetical protein
LLELSINQLIYIYLLGGPAVMANEAEKGGEFQYLGGNITGKFLEVREDPPGSELGMHRVIRDLFSRSDSLAGYPDFKAAK